jgi:hypothetical protein
MWKENKGNVRRNLMMMTVSPLLFLLTLVQSSRVEALATFRDSGEPTYTVTTQRDHVNTLPNQRAAVQPLLQFTTTPPVELTVTVTAPAAIITATGALTPTLAISAVDELTATAPLTAVQVLTTPTTDAPADTAADAAYAEPIEGTIIANRTETDVRFFVEGATYTLDPLRSIGLDLPRVTAVLNLFNCDASLPETTEGCFWDPFLLDRDGFYEIVTSSEEGSTSLALQPAGSPPVNQIWLQNRTGKRETIFYQNEEIELPPAAVREFASQADVPAIFYLRSCLALPDRTVCEWAPSDAEPGYYYALEETTIAGTLPSSEIVALELQPILSRDGDPVEMPAQVSCQLQVPTLNVRSGPGLEYQIIAKIRGSDQEPGRITAVGRDEASEWLAVDERIAAGGWVIANPSFIQCSGDVNALPVAEVSDGRLAPTPEPVTAPAQENNPPVTTEPEEPVVPEESAPTATAEPETAAPQSLAEGQALIVINNGFDQQIRFTLDQRYRVEQGVSEYDLQPGQSVSLLVYPGQLAFSASSPWRGLSGNSEFFIDNKETRSLWLTFVPDPDGSGRWILQY